MPVAPGVNVLLLSQLLDKSVVLSLRVSGCRHLSLRMEDSKSGEGNLVWVRVPPPAQCKSPANVGVFLICTQRFIFTGNCRTAVKSVRNISVSFEPRQSSTASLSMRRSHSIGVTTQFILCSSQHY